MTARPIARALLAAALVGAASVGIAQTRPPAPSPGDLYHQGARLFVDGDDDAALAAVEAGLARAPDNARLQALRDLILQNQDENDQPDDQDPQDGGGQQDPQDGDESQDETQDGEQSQRPPEAERDGTAQQPSQPSGQPQPQDAARLGEMTEAQAERLLDAVGGEERLLLREMQRSTGERRRSDKDW